MKTTATNRKIGDLLSSLSAGALEPRPEFQRRLVWSAKHKQELIKTVLLGFPFPEIYIAAGSVDTETGARTELLVDGQQRLTTLYQYFAGSPELKLGQDGIAYRDLDEPEKEAFLEYDVVVRDLGRLDEQEIIEIFRRINSTNYALNAMEVHHARYAGKFLEFGEHVAALPFFEEHRLFTATDGRRMNDTRYSLNLAVTLMTTYFNRDADLESYLARFIDDFPEAKSLLGRFESTFAFINACSLPVGSRAWKKVDLFTLVAEIDRAINRENLRLDAAECGQALQAFYDRVNARDAVTDSKEPEAVYYKHSLQATNDRSSRIARGEAIQAVLKTCAVLQ